MIQESANHEEKARHAENIIVFTKYLQERDASNEIGQQSGLCKEPAKGYMLNESEIDTKSETKLPEETQEEPTNIDPQSEDGGEGPTLVYPSKIDQAVPGISGASSQQNLGLHSGGNEKVGMIVVRQGTDDGTGVVVVKKFIEDR